MPPAYDPRQVEGEIYRLWEEGGYFTPKIDPQKKPFTIIMPPPNVTGELHLGHALTAAIEDALIRWHRMQGEPALWLPGEDHAGIATQNVVEQELAREGLSRHDLGRERFLERVWEWARRYRQVIADQHRRLGASCDWSRERFTLDPGPAKAVRTTFVNLYRDGLIYRGERIINWCPRCRTALSDLEVEHQPLQGHLWYVRYPGVEGDFSITVATTRPETILADVAVAVNPQDERYRPLLGREVLVPIIGRRVPIIADEAVDPAFGTGALKITPGHDPVDFEVGQRHSLEALICIDEDGRMNALAGPYQGLDRFACRQAIVRDMEAQGLLEKVEPYSHAVGHCQRCGTVVEPRVSTQWFVRMEPLARRALQAVREGRIRIVPRRFERDYFHWLENIRDWCISRQLWWGHRIPVWYCDDCQGITVDMTDPDRCQSCGSTRIHQDPDVLDTWFSSALWPHSTLGWPDDTEDLRYFYPTSVMETGYDILFFWVARMIMMGLYNTGEVPFHTVYLHGLIRDEAGQKMSKSRGNVINPIDACDRYGTDALRFVLVTASSPGNDMRISQSRLEGGRNFANKLWNAARFVLHSLEEGRVEALRPDRSRPLEDRWILSRAYRLVEQVNALLRDFELDEAGRRIHDFLWHEYCDWYIEMAKVRLGAGDRSPLPVLAHVLDLSLRLLHPFMPFITEALWQRLKAHLPQVPAEALIIAPWPQADPAWLDGEAEEEAEAVMEVVRAIRNLRAEGGVEPKRYVEAYVAADDHRHALLACRPAIEVLARARPLHILADAGELPQEEAATAVLKHSRVALPLRGLYDPDVERRRLRREVGEAEAEIARLEAKLANPQFRQKAPAAVVAREEEKLTQARERLQALRERLAGLEAR